MARARKRIAKDRFIKDLILEKYGAKRIQALMRKHCANCPHRNNPFVAKVTENGSPCHHGLLPLTLEGTPCPYAGSSPKLEEGAMSET